MAQHGQYNVEDENYYLREVTKINQSQQKVVLVVNKELRLKDKTGF